MAGVKLEWAQFGDFDSFSIYKSLTSIDENILPTPIKSGLAKMYFVDSDVATGKKYYYRVGMFKDGVEYLSDQIEIDIPSDITSAVIFSFMYLTNNIAKAADISKEYRINDIDNINYFYAEYFE